MGSHEHRCPVHQEIMQYPTLREAEMATCFGFFLQLPCNKDKPMLYCWVM